MADFKLLVAMLLLSEPSPLDAADTMAVLNGALNTPVSISADNATGEVSADPGAPLLLSVDGRRYAMVSLPAPTPPGHLESLYGRSFGFPDAREILPAHRAHIVLAPFHEMPDQLSVRQAAADITRMAAALAGPAGALGIAWGGSDVAVPPQEATRMAVRLAQGEPPVGLWVGLSLHSPRPEELILQSHGLQSFLGFEMQVVASPDRLDPSIARFYETAAYLLSQGDVIEDGDLVGAVVGSQLRAERGALPNGLPILRLTPP